MVRNRKWILLVVGLALILSGIGIVVQGLRQHEMTRHDRPNVRPAVYYHDHRLAPVRNI